MAPAAAAPEGGVVTTAAPKAAAFVAKNTTSLLAKGPHKGLVFDKWPFRFDVSVEYQDWILVGMSFLILSFWCLPCICGRMRNPVSRKFTSWVYTRLHVFFFCITYINLTILFFTTTTLPDWTVNDYGLWLVKFLTWILVHLEKMLTSAAILCGFAVMLSLRKKIATAAGLEHVTLFRFSWRDMLPGGAGRKRPVEVFIWKVEDIQSGSTKVLKPNDMYVECHMGYNEPMRTRVHNNAGSSCVIKESFQMNIDEDSTSSIMTLLVKDQSLIASQELARLLLSTREICGIEDQTGKRRLEFQYNKDCFVPLKLWPNGQIFLAIAPVEDGDEEKAPLMGEDSLVTC